MPGSPRRSPRRRGAALADLVVVLLIIAVLISLVVPMMMTARDRADRTRCMMHLRDIGQAMRRYADDHAGQLPMVRWSRAPQVFPDVSNAGWDSPDPFSLAGPPANNVPAALFLLVRTQHLDPQALLCPATLGQPERFDDAPAAERSNFHDVHSALTYGIQNPYADDNALVAGFNWTLKDLGPQFVLAADRGPAPNYCDPAVGPGAVESLRQANSQNHSGRGQNVLYAHGGVEYVESPFAGIARDHIYRSKRGGVFASPAGRGDTVLLPTDE